MIIFTNILILIPNFFLKKKKTCKKSKEFYRILSMSSRISKKSKKGKKGKGKGKKDEEDQIRNSLIPEVQRRFTYLFEIYDIEKLGTIAAEDFPDFVRSLGLCPTNAKMNELADLCREKEGDDYFVNSFIEQHLTPLVIDVMVNPNNELAPPKDELLTLALKSLDLEHKGHLTEGDFRTTLANNGEALDPDEIDPALDEALNRVTGVIDFDRYANKMLYNSHLSYQPKVPEEQAVNEAPQQNNQENAAEPPNEPLNSAEPA